MIAGLQGNNFAKAIEAGIEVVNQHDGKFSDDNAEKNVGLRLTLANILVSVRKAPAVVVAGPKGAPSGGSGPRPLSRAPSSVRSP